MRRRDGHARCAVIGVGERDDLGGEGGPVIGALDLFALRARHRRLPHLEDWTWVDSFYFSAVALTTVGFGDLSPSTDVSKLFTVFYIFSGISLIGATLNEVAKRHARRMNARAKGSSDT